MRELFIYYRLSVAHTALARSIVERFQSELMRRHPGLEARLLCRPGSDEGVQTWMETYRCHAGTSPAGVHEALAAEIEREAESLAGLIAGPRHVELFVPCAS